MTMTVLVREQTFTQAGSVSHPDLATSDAQTPILQAQQMRSEAVGGMLHRGAAKVWQESGLAALTDALLRTQRQRRTAAELSRLDDALLRDIGVLRGDIPFVAEQAVAARRPAAQRPSWAARRRQARLRRSIVRQLEVLPDWALEDIGIPRYDIETVAARMAAEQAKAPATATPEAPSAQPAARPAAPVRVSPVHDLVHQLEAALRPLRQWQMSRVAANQMARLDPDMLADLGYVKGDVDWVPEILARRRLGKPANQDGHRVGAA